MKNPYEVLGLSKDAAESELKERYESLAAKYREDRFLPGEEGNEAAFKLNELEDAWREISRFGRPQIQRRLFAACGADQRKKIR